jgi:hypothetical protein
MSTDSRATPDAGDGLVERLTLHLDRFATGDRVRGDAADGAAVFPVETLTDELRLAATWADPPAGLRDTILSRVRDEAAVSLAGEPAPDLESTVEPRPGPAPVPDAPVPDANATSPEVTPALAPPRARRPWSWAAWRGRWTRLAWAVPAAALAAAVFTGAVVYVDRTILRDPPPSAVYSAAGTSLAPDATAQVAVHPTGAGFVIMLTIDDLPAAAPGSYYAAWLSGPQGAVPIGSFHQRRTGIPVRLWSGVDPARYPTLIVTLQAEGDPATPSALVVMTGAMTR